MEGGRGGTGVGNTGAERRGKSVEGAGMMKRRRWESWRVGGIPSKSHVVSTRPGQSCCYVGLLLLFVTIPVGCGTAILLEILG